MRLNVIAAASFGLALGLIVWSTMLQSEVQGQVGRQEHLPEVTRDAQHKPENLAMTLARIADAGEPHQYVFVLNGVVAYRTVEGLKKHLKGLPKASTVTWAPGCCRIGNEPLLSSRDEMKKFKEFCESVGIKFILIPSG